MKDKVGERTFGGADREQMLAQDRADMLELAQPNQTPTGQDSFKDLALL